MGNLKIGEFENMKINEQLNTKYYTPNTKYYTPNTKYYTPNTKYYTLNTTI
jgi:hypothetical protein